MEAAKREASARINNGNMIRRWGINREDRGGLCVIQQEGVRRGQLHYS